MIAGLPQAPSEYNPFLTRRRPSSAETRCCWRWCSRATSRQGDYDQASQADLGLIRGHKYQTIREPYFFDYVQQQLIDRYGVNTVRNGGLKVYTTINPQLQARRPARLDSCAVCYSGGGPAAALASVDPTNGHILAMASSQPYSPTSQFNLAADAHRQPGSSFKPYVLADRDQPGDGPRHHLLLGQEPVTLTLPDEARPGPSTTPSRAAGTMSVRERPSTRSTRLRPARPRRRARQRAQDRLRDGDHDPSRRDPGRGHRRPADRGHPARAGGRLRHLRRRGRSTTRPPRSARSCSRTATPTCRARSSSSRAFSDGVAYEMTDVLKGVITSGTGTAAGHRLPGRRQDRHHRRLHRRLVRGLHAALSTAVWVGYPERPRPSVRRFGGTHAGPIWHDYMTAAHGSYCGDFPSPRTRSSSRAPGAARTRSPGHRHRPAPADLADHDAVHRLDHGQVSLPVLRAGRRAGALPQPARERKRERQLRWGRSPGRRSAWPSRRRHGRRHTLTR